jgi:hypothetical protein
MRSSSLILSLLTAGVSVSAVSASTLQYTTGNPDFFGWTWKSAAVRFTMPSDSSYRLDALDMCVVGNPSAVALDVTVWSDTPAGPTGTPLFVLPSQAWHESFGMSWNHFDLSSANLTFEPGASYYAGYTSAAANHADVGVFVDSHATSGRSSGVNIEYGSNWMNPGGELYFKTDVTAVPEPATMGMLLIAATACTIRRRRDSTR